METLRSSQDLLITVSIIWVFGFEKFSSLIRRNEGGDVGRAVRFPYMVTMTLVVLLAIRLIACMFLLYVLLQWMRDTNRRPREPRCDHLHSSTAQKNTSTSRRNASRGLAGDLPGQCWRIAFRRYK
jgi:hypothetical protein